MHKVYKRLLFLLTVGLLIGFFGSFVYRSANRRQIRQSNNQLQVTASFYPLYFFASEIGGVHAQVFNITPAGTEPHDFEPSPRDIAQIESSSILLLNGSGLESWGEKVIKNVNPTKVLIVTVRPPSIPATTRDPHYWLSPMLAKDQVEIIAAAFVQKDPVHAQYYDANKNRLLQQLSSLDLLFKSSLATCKAKDLITSHDAFSYLTQSYGLRQISIAGLSPDEEPSPAKMAEIVAFVRSQSISTIFFEDLVNSKLSDTIAHEAGAKTMVLYTIEGLKPEEQKQGLTYFSLMQQNLTNLKLALQCQ